MADSDEEDEVRDVDPPEDLVPHVCLNEAVAQLHGIGKDPPANDTPEDQDEDLEAPGGLLDRSN